ncbi:hypothetical protein HNO92_000764 [Chromobacterium alkanivorans]|uniref:hypothetical protein n=1 Tax=Chromobacterium alkanivorans TaxID=1071719 RepID=UPI002166EEE0|nr:hypothetical protein [Chromobacterium alkanivorans]MCS3803104.1 hypothetical protein [Chromobacterium alkanivorans]MCS3817786.1 hypothetical protein [Chromobacterium alkanivorans]MCS3872470.1 hypothetical protein [Chromobacterium alkanivorans]
MPGFFLVWQWPVAYGPAGGGAPRKHVLHCSNVDKRKSSAHAPAVAIENAWLPQPILRWHSKSRSEKQKVDAFHSHSAAIWRHGALISDKTMCMAALQQYDELFCNTNEIPIENQ